MTQDLNIQPYYDDFDENKNFYKILFKPGFAVQARELTQLQSILQNQIKKFGNHVFQHGSVVIPGNSRADTASTYVRIQAVGFDVMILEGQTITGTSGVRAYVRKVIPASGADAGTLYVAYNSGGTNGESVFGVNEVLTSSTTFTMVTTEFADATGTGSLAFVNAGVYYVNGIFASVSSQSIVIDKYGSAPNCHVLLQITESIVDSDAESTLLDPAQGSYNFAAPGADRFKLALTLVSLPLNSVIGDDYVELMRFNEGTLEEHSRYPKYAELAKSLARRTYDESGDYIVSGLDVSVREHLRSGMNGGLYDVPDGDAAKFVVYVTPGKAYIRGFENEIISKRTVALNKGRSVDHIANKTNVSLNPKFGQFFYVNNMVGLPDFNQRHAITLWNSVPTNGAATQIGTAKVLALDYHEPNTTDSNAIHKLYVTEMQLNSGVLISDVSGYKFTGGVHGSGSGRILHLMNVPNGGVDFQLDEIVNGANGRLAKVAKWARSTSELFIFRDNATVVGPQQTDKIVGATSTATGEVTSVTFLGGNLSNSSVIPLPDLATYRVRTATNTLDMSYKVYKQLTINLDGAGFGSATVTGMTIDPKEQGNMIIVGPAGLFPISIATVSVDGLSLTINGGPASTTLSIIVAATKTNQANKSKTYVASYSEVGITPANSITLEKADIESLVSIIDSTDGDVTNRYTFDNGQRDYAYLRGSLTLTGALPSGTLTITYNYFSHSGSGDYFSIDSYESSGIPDYANRIPTYVSQSDGKRYFLGACLDFRTRIGDNGTYTAPTASLIDLVQVDSRITTSVQYFVPRYDIVTMNKSGQIEVVGGIPNVIAKVPTLPEESLLLATLYIPAYTPKIRDIKVVASDNQGYTMKEISGIEKRIYNLEQYALLTQSERSLVESDIIDAATGLSRYKSGYLVDTFDNPDIIADVFNPEFSVTYTNNMIIPKIETHDCTMSITSNTGTVTGGFVTLPYTEVTFAKQGLSSRVTNVNPFAVFSWIGAMSLIPSSDNWTETENLAPIFFSETNVISQTVEIIRPWTGATAPVLAGPIITTEPGQGGWGNDSPDPGGGGFGQDAQSGNGLGSTSDDGDSNAFGGSPTNADQAGTTSGGGGGGDKIICTAMNELYGFGGFRQSIWLKYSETHMTKAHEVGYHTLFLPMVSFAYKQGDGMANRMVRSVLEHGTRHRTKDIRAELRGSKRDTLGRFYRSIFEPLCYAVGWLKGHK
jgi:hypothetical protein